jgi:hypothetical protein
MEFYESERERVQRMRQISCVGDSEIDKLEEENEVDNDDLLNLVSNSLSSSDDTGPPVSEKRSKIIN